MADEVQLEQATLTVLPLGVMRGKDILLGKDILDSGIVTIYKEGRSWLVQADKFEEISKSRKEKKIESIGKMEIKLGPRTVKLVEVLARKREKFKLIKVKTCQKDRAELSKRTRNEVTEGRTHVFWLERRSFKKKINRKRGSARFKFDLAFTITWSGRKNKELPKHPLRLVQIGNYDCSAVVYDLGGMEFTGKEGKTSRFHLQNTNVRNRGRARGNVTVNGRTISTVGKESKKHNPRLRWRHLYGSVDEGALACNWRSCADDTTEREEKSSMCAYCQSKRRANNYCLDFSDMSNIENGPPMKHYVNTNEG